MPSYEISDYLIRQRQESERFDIQNQFERRVQELIDEGNEVNEPYLGNDGQNIIWYDNDGGRNFTRL